jgi:hypothetical protein
MNKKTIKKCIDVLERIEFNSPKHYGETMYIRECLNDELKMRVKAGEAMSKAQKKRWRKMKTK